MHSTIFTGLDQQATWRAALARSVGELARFLGEQELLDASEQIQVDSLLQRLKSDKLTVAFVAEFSRGKSELINAIFFADTGRRILPATPGRTTMCPVEMFYEPDEPPQLSLLPIETRLKGLSLAELRQRDEPWEHVPLDPTKSEALAKALGSVTRTLRVTIETAEKLGFWHPDRPDDNPQVETDGMVEVPAWRHALINYPHPLLQRGLVVLDTPGLNAIGAEPELTLGLLPTAHATVFILAADAGVTRSDLAIWREHLSGDALERFVVLNKVDALADPLLSKGEVAEQIARQRRLTAETLGLPVTRVFPLSARDALAARLAQQPKVLQRSGLPALESALLAELLPRQADLVAQAVGATVQGLRDRTAARLADQRRHLAEQTLELRGLRGKSGAKVRLMLQRLEQEAVEFERCTARLSALRAVLARQLRGALGKLSSDTLRTEMAAMVSATSSSLLKLGARKAYGILFDRLRKALTAAQEQTNEMQSMLDASFRQLNADFGFSFAIAPAPDLARFMAELDLIDKRYGGYLSLSQTWRLAAPGFIEQFRRMLLSRLRVVFETTAGEVELWSKGASAQVDIQLRERRRSFQRRREALERIQSAAGELELRLGEVEAAEERLKLQLHRVDEMTAESLALAREPGQGAPQVSAA